MADENYDYSYYNEFALRIRDMEEKQRILKDRLILVGENLVETKEKTSEDILGLKKDLEEVKKTLERVKEVIETISSEFPNFARKEDVEILAKQAKMFQPLDFIRKSDLEKLKKK